MGDNLNLGFPEGIGVHLYVARCLPSELGASSAQVVSDALRISGTPFGTLGPLDLAMFFRTDSNTNEAGIFELQVTQGS